MVNSRSIKKDFPNSVAPPINLIVSDIDILCNIVEKTFKMLCAFFGILRGVSQRVCFAGYMEATKLFPLKNQFV
jgi:hypothetical protein